MSEIQDDADRELYEKRKQLRAEFERLRAEPYAEQVVREFLCAPERREIEWLKAQHEEMLLKHVREQNVALETLEAALKEIGAQKGLLTRAADALEQLSRLGPQMKSNAVEFITELRKKAE